MAKKKVAVDFEQSLGDCKSSSSKLEVRNSGLEAR